MSSTESQPIVRTVASTQSEMTEIILPNDAKYTLGNLLGGPPDAFHRSDGCRIGGLIATRGTHAL